LWRDTATRSTQNRIGLKNPGVEATAQFLAVHKRDLPTVYGINVAVTPGVADPDEQKQEVYEALNAFVRRGMLPAWFTLNLSCPNTEDDPTGNQSEELALMLTGALIKTLNDLGHKTPLWVKIGPTLSETQVRALMRAFAETGVRAVIATNTLPEPTPDDPTIAAGVAGGRLHNRAVEIACWAAQEKAGHGYPVDVIGCGGVEDGATYRDFARYGAVAVQYLSALIYRGPLAAALIQKEALHG
jgi:dihydroorotate dehydrogenase